MITVNEADKIIAAQAKILPAKLYPLTECYGAVLREDVLADRDQPPFDKALVDGIAINLAGWQKTKSALKIEGVQATGQKALSLKNKEKGCIKIMTGAVVPLGCDCIVPIELVMISGHKAHFVPEEELRSGQNIRRQGTDCKVGTLLLKSGTELLPPHIATAASVGKSKLRITVRARVAIISNGDELVDIDKTPIKPFEIRKSNSYALDAILKQTTRCESQIFHFPDNKSVLKRKIRDILKKFDILVLSGGVSMGDFDYIPQVLKELGVSVLFHKVSQRPGKPFWFGKSKKEKIVFALPGNPVSTQVCAYRYLVPYLKAVSGQKVESRLAALESDFASPTHFTYFLPVKARYNKNGNIEAVPVKTGGSGDYGSLSQADGFIQLSASQNKFFKGQIVPFYPWK